MNINDCARAQARAYFGPDQLLSASAGPVEYSKLQNLSAQLLWEFATYTYRRDGEF